MSLMGKRHEYTMFVLTSEVCCHGGASSSGWPIFLPLTVGDGSAYTTSHHCRKSDNIIYHVQDRHAHDGLNLWALCGNFNYHRPLWAQTLELVEGMLSTKKLNSVMFTLEAVPELRM